MTRLFTATMESGTAAGEGLTFTGTPTFEATSHLGSLCLRTNAVSTYATAPISGVLGRFYYVRTYFRRSTAPASDMTVFQWNTSGGPICNVNMSTTGALKLTNAIGTVLGTSSVIPDVTYTRVEIAIKVPAAGNGEVYLYIEGTQEVGSASTNVGNSAITGWNFGDVSAATSLTVRNDDVAINDDQGASDNGLPGPAGFEYHKNLGTDIWPKISTAPTGGGSAVYESHSNFNTTAATTAVAIPKPTGLAVNDLVLAHFILDGIEDTLATLSGWTLQAGPNDTSPTSDVRSYVFSRIADAGDVAGSGWTFTKTGVARGTSGDVIRISNVNTATPIDDIGIGTGSATTAHVTAAFDTTEANQLVIALAGTDLSAAGGTYTATGSMTLIASYNPSALFLVNGSAWEQVVTPATNITRTLTGPSDEWTAYGISIKGASSNPPTAGQVYYNTADSKFYGFNGTIWLEL